MKLTDEDKQGLSASEILALERDEEDTSKDAVIVSDKKEDKQDDKIEGESDAAAQDDGDDSLEESTTEHAPKDTAPPKFTVDETRDFAAEMKNVRAERAGIEDKWTTGEINDAERNVQLADLDEKRDALLVAQTRTQTLLEINDQNTARAAQAVLKAEDEAIMALVDADAKLGESMLNYKGDTAAQRDFDAALTATKNSSTHAGKTAAEQVQAAHRMVLSMRGIAQPAASPAPAPAAPIKSGRRDVPMSLGGLPNAGRAEGGVTDDNWTKFSTLNGDASERFLASLSEGEVDRLTRLADAKMFK